MRTAIYCRVSTEDQEKEGTNLQTQLEACLRYCQEKGYEVLSPLHEHRHDNMDIVIHPYRAENPGA